MHAAAVTVALMLLFGGPGRVPPLLVVADVTPAAATECPNYTAAGLTTENAAVSGSNSPEQNPSGTTPPPPPPPPPTTAAGRHGTPAESESSGCTIDLDARISDAAFASRWI